MIYDIGSGRQVSLQNPVLHLHLCICHPPSRKSMDSYSTEWIAFDSAIRGFTSIVHSSPALTKKSTSVTIPHNTSMSRISI